MDLFNRFKGTLRSLLNSYQKFVCKKEFDRQTFVRFNERPVEYDFVFRYLKSTYPHDILDVGSGISALPSLMRDCGFLVTAVDNVKDYWSTGMFNRHYHVIDDDISKTRLTSKFDLVTCISVLEHVKDPDSAFSNMIGLLKPGGRLIVTFPYHEKNYQENVYQLPGSSYGQENPYATRMFSRNELDAWIRNEEIEIVKQEYWKFWAGDFWTSGEQIIPPREVNCDELHQLTCIIFQKN